MTRFTYLRPDYSGLAPEYRSQYLTVRELVKWEIDEDTGHYSGFIILGEQILGIHPPPPGFVPSANMTIDFGEKEVSSAKMEELCLRVGSEFFDPYVGMEVWFGSSTIQ